jgi:copper/silver efflux system protein
MPTTVPRASIAEVERDLRVRDAILRGFPEVWQVVGKAGRAETPTDVAPLDMIETVINLRDHQIWPRRKLRFEDIVAQTRVVLATLESKGSINAPPSAVDREQIVSETAMTVAAQVDEVLRDLAARRLAEFRPALGRALTGEAITVLLSHVDPAAIARKPTTPEREELVDSLSKTHGERLAIHVLADDVNEVIREASRRLLDLGVLRDRPDLLAPPPALLDRAAVVASDMLGFTKPTLFSRIADHLSVEHERRLKEKIKSLNWELFDRAVGAVNWAALDALTKLARERSFVGRDTTSESLQTLRAALDKPFADGLLLWRKTKTDLVEEMSTALQMPGWGNSFTQPIAARIEMLSTGVRLPVAVKVFGSNLETIQRVSQEIAAVVRGVRGAADVFADQIVGKGYVEIKIDRKKAARYGINVGDIQDVVEVALGGKPLTMTVEGRERYPVRARYARDYRDGVDAIKNILVSARGKSMDVARSAGMGGMTAPTPFSSATASNQLVQIPLAELADIRVVEGPSMIKSENGLLRSYIQLRVRGRDEVGFVEEARRVVAESIKLPTGTYLEWTGTFEHQVRAQKTLRIVFPAVIAVIVLILYLTHKSWVDALLMMTSVLGALAGGAIFQWLFGFHFSVAVQVGYIACFGMAVETSVVMLVYLHEAIAERGGLEQIGSIAELRQAILEGAVHRLRPKLLTEGAAIVAIAPMLWATGVGSEVIRPMAAPVLGGLLVADEVIDVFLPVLYFAVCKRRWAKLHGASQWRERAATSRPTLPISTT